MPLADDAELAAWLRLLLVPGVGRETARRLLAAYGAPEAVVDASEASLRTVIGPALAAAVHREPAAFAATLEAVRRWQGAGTDRAVVVVGDARYPAALLQSPDPPLLLYVQGSLDVLDAARGAIAVVGSRTPTPQGRDHAHQFAQAFAQAGRVVVSGLALGIDGAAHEGALEGGGPTVAVVATGLDRVYPRRHHALAHRIAASGALVSEFAPGTPALAEHFPMRNRIIAGLAQGTLVVEAALPSGSLITARLANEAGRDVFAIPGSIQSMQSRGCHALIRDGAKLVERPQDVLDELRQPPLAGWPSGDAPAPSPAPAEPDRTPDALLDALGHDPCSLDSLQARTGEPTERLLARLLELELDGRIARQPGGLYQRRGVG